jgi:hypothetical protein
MVKYIVRGNSDLIRLHPYLYVIILMNNNDHTRLTVSIFLGWALWEITKPICQTRPELLLVTGWVGSSSWTPSD